MLKNKLLKNNSFKFYKKRSFLVRFPKIKNIHYSYHISNFLAGLVINQRNLKSKYTYFYTKFLHRFSKTLSRVGLVSSVKVFHKSFDSQLKKKIVNFNNTNISTSNLIFFSNSAYLKKYNSFSTKIKKEIATDFVFRKDRPSLSIDLKYNFEKPLINSIFMYSRPGRRLHVSCYSLDKLAKLNPGSTILISNADYGVIDHMSAIRVGIGGLLLCKIN